MAGRPTLPLGSWGAISTQKVRGGSWRARAAYRDLDGVTRRVTSTGPTRAAAQRALREALAERTKPAGDLITNETRLKDLAAYWLNHLETEGRIEQTTINEYRRVLDKHVLPALGGLRLQETTTGRLDRHLAALRDLSVNRQRKAKVVLGAMLDIAVRHDALVVNPARNTSRVYRPRTEARALNADDLVTLRAAVREWASEIRPGPNPGNDMADIVDMMLATGCRIGEVLALRWSDVDLEAEPPRLSVTGTIKTETGRGTYRKDSPKSAAGFRTLALPNFAVDLLRRRRSESRTSELDAVFATRNGTWHQIVNVERRWRQIRRDTGFDWVTPHTFRKTVATLISERAGDEEASRQLGHSSSQITRDYYIAKPPIAPNMSAILEDLIHPSDGS